MCVFFILHWNSIIHFDRYFLKAQISIWITCRIYYIRIKWYYLSCTLIWIDSRRLDVMQFICKQNIITWRFKMFQLKFNCTQNCLFCFPFAHLNALPYTAKTTETTSDNDKFKTNTFVYWPAVNDPHKNAQFDSSTVASIKL